MKLVEAPRRKTLEYKRDLSSPDSILKCLVAFANTGSGIIVIGVEDGSKNVPGVTDALAAEEKLANLVPDSIRPRLAPDLRMRSVELLAKMPTQVLGSNSVRADASGDRIVRDAASRYRAARSWASKPAAATVIWRRLGVSGQRGRMAVGEYPTRHSVVGVFALGNLSARFSLNAVTSTANGRRWPKAPIGRERAHTGTECITQLNDEHA